MENKGILPRDYDGSQYGINLDSISTQKMYENGPTHQVLQETIYGWLKGATIFCFSGLKHLTYADFVEHIGCDAQEFSFKSLEKQRVYTWIAKDKPTAKFAAFFQKNEVGEWTIWATGSTQIHMPENFIENLNKK